MSGILIGFLIASLLHMTEEYFLPGGFLRMMKLLNPRFAPFVTVPVAILFNGLQLALCAFALVIGARGPMVGLSVAGLLFVNGLVHLGGCVRAGGYAPGAATGLVLYLPLSTFAYILALTHRMLSIGAVLLTGALGIAFQLLPIGYLAVASGIRASGER